MITFNRDKIRDRIHACWLGKNIGGTMGAPFEGKTELNDIQGFSTPEGVVLPNDDLDLQIVWLRALENVGPNALDARALGEYWADYIPPNWNEYGICKANMRVGLPPPLCGEYQNVWKHSNGAWIRTEIWACLAPGCPDVAIRYAREDACVDHGSGEGTFAAIFVAAVESAAFVERDIRRLVQIGLSKIPADCRVARSVKLLLECHGKGDDWKTCRERLVADSADLGWFQAPCNVAFAMLGLLYGEGDFKKSMILAINCGDDTDCTGATLGALWGILHGTAGIPADWAAHIGDAITTIAINRGALYCIPATCAELTDRVIAMQGPLLKANFVEHVRFGDGAEGADPEDVAFFSDGRFAKTLCEASGMSYAVDFLWGRAEVLYEDKPEIRPNGSARVTLRFTNQFPDQKHLRLRWLLPEGFTVRGAPRDLFLQQCHPRHKIDGTASFACTITAGERTEPVNRPVLEVTCPNRPTAGYVPVVLLG